MREEVLVDGRFRLEAEVAVGGMGRLWRARDEHTQRLVALKVIATDEPGAEERFRREAQLLSKLRHPALVEHVAHGATVAGEPYLAMEWLEGRDLRAALAQRSDATLPAKALPTSSFETADVVAFARRVASALGELHRHGVVHRDVKPANVFLEGSDLRRAKLVDLGAAAILDGPRRLTMTGGLVGTPAYMAPEQVRATEGVTPAADVWALGCVIYECLTGGPAFRAQHLVALLAKIRLDPPPSLDPRRGVPESLRAFVDRCLAKDPADRFADGDAMLDALRDVDEVTGPSMASGSFTPSLGGTERRVRCVVVGSLPPSAEHRRAEVERAAARGGGVVAWLSPGSFVMTADPPGAPMDQATRVGRVALFVRHAVPEVGLALGLGPAERSSGHLPVGDAVDRAAALLQSTEPGEVRVESSTVPLLEARFDLSLAGSRACVVGERTHEATRTLLGKPTVSVGRRRELGTLTGAWDHAVEEPAASVLLVAAPAGMGKSRLRYELLRTLRQRGETFTLLEGRGDALSAGSPFGLVVPAIRRWVGVREADPPELVQEALGRKLTRRLGADELERVWLFLCELVGAPLLRSDDPALRAARSDPMLLAEATKRAFCDWIEAECEAQPVLFVLEDLHWGDVPSVRFVEAALTRVPDRPLLVLALARPEVHERFAGLWDRHSVQEVRLGALSKAASIQLVEQVIGDVDPTLADELATRASGNAFHLEELIRAAAEGSGARLPETVLAMVQSRIDALGQEAKRVLRAAAVFGESFWSSGVESLLGESGGASVEEWLTELAAREVVSAQPTARFSGQREWRFRHALMRDGAYELLTTEDRALGHRLAASWLGAVGETDARVLAEHFDRGDEPQEAARWLARGAEQALEGNDLDGALDSVARALMLLAPVKADGETREEVIRDPERQAVGAPRDDAPEGTAGTREGVEETPARDADTIAELHGQLHATESLARYWKSDYAGALAAGRSAAATLREGSRAWYRALGSATVASARLGDFTSVDALFQRLVSAHAELDAEAERLVGLARGTFQLIFAGRFEEADRVLTKIAALAEDEDALDALTLAQVHHVRGVRACMIGDVGTFLHHLAPAVEHFERAGDLRNASLERTTLAWCHAEVGDFDEAARIARANLTRCEAMGAQQAITYAKVNLGYVLIHVEGTRDEARKVLGEAIAECRAVGNARLAGWALTHLASLERLEGAREREEASAREAAALLAASPGLEAWALARRALACLELDRRDEALECAGRAYATLERLGGLIQGESVVPLAFARVLRASGETARADEVLTKARARLAERAARIHRDEWRAGFLAHPENAALAAE